MNRACIIGGTLLMLLACRQENQSHHAQNQDLAEGEWVESLFGDTLRALADSESIVNKKDSLLHIAYSDYQKDSESLDNIIWYGRRIAYQYDYKKAIEIFSEGIESHPDAPELYRHRGHRYISIREFDYAKVDFKKAALLTKNRPIEIEEDGIPNKMNKPLSSLQFNIYYHWALAYYLKGEMSKAAELWERCMEYSTNPDLLVATTDWYYMTLKRMGENAKAASLLEDIDTDMDIIENASYHKRLLMYKGQLEPEDLLDLSNTSEKAQLDIVTQGYGVGNYYLYNGDEGRAYNIFNSILKCDYWPAFGFIAAEAEVYRKEKDKKGPKGNIL